MVSHGALVDEEEDWRNKRFPTYGSSNTPLGIAAANPKTDEDLIKCLLDKNISEGKSVPVEVLFSAIHSCKSNHLNSTAFDLLYENPSMFWYKLPGHRIARSNGQSILHESAKKDAVAILENILKHTEIDVNAVNSLGLTALHEACQWASNKCVEVLMAGGADMNTPSCEAVLDTDCLYYNALGFLIKAKREDLVAQVRYPKSLIAKHIESPIRESTWGLTFDLVAAATMEDQHFYTLL